MEERNNCNIYYYETSIIVSRHYMSHTFYGKGMIAFVKWEYVLDVYYPQQYCCFSP